MLFATKMARIITKGHRDEPHPASSRPYTSAAGDFTLATGFNEKGTMMRKSILATGAAMLLCIHSPLMAKKVESSLLVGIEQISTDNSVYGSLDNLTLAQLVMSGDRFHFDGRLNSHLDLIIGGGDVFNLSADFGLRYGINDRLFVGPLIGYGIHEILKDGKTIESTEREAIALSGMHYGLDMRYKLTHRFVLTGGIKTMRYRDTDYSDSQTLDNKSLYGRLGFYW